MSLRGRSSGPAWVVAAVVVALVATGGALRLFVHAVRDTIRADDAVATIASQPAGSEDVTNAGTDAWDYPEAEVGDSEEPAPDPIVIRFTLDRSVRVARFLEEAGLSSSEATRWSDVFEGTAHTRLLSSGRLISLYKDPETGDLRGFRYDLDNNSSLVEQGFGNGVVLTGERPIQYVVKPISVAFAIRDDFDKEVARRGIPKPVVESLQDAFRDNRPVEALPPGAGMKLIYSEVISRDGTHRMPGDLEAAQVTVGGHTLDAFAFRDEHGREHMYDESGKALGPQTLRFPLPFEYISSGFASARWHPILHKYRPHVGIDLVAQYGTPVKAIADGKVESSGWAGELGNCVRLAHDHDMVSIYGHLSRISSEVRPDGYVKVGQVIGWVGSTGLSTGPHLHFAILHEGQYVNPLSQKLGTNHEVSPRLRALFDQVTQRYQTLLASLPDLGIHRVMAAERKPAISQFGDLYHVELKRHAPTRTKFRGMRTVAVESAVAAGGM
jgi:murein DD-endopeptidase MepM/ murein hydrolase activator NlpD